MAKPLSKKISAKQAEVLEFIRHFASQSGFPPTITEIQEHFGWSSQNAAVFHINALERLGHIEVARKVARGIRVIAGKREVSTSVSSATLNIKTSMNNHDALIFDGFMDRQPLCEITLASKADDSRVTELCRRAFLKGMEHEQLLAEYGERNA